MAARHCWDALPEPNALRVWGTRQRCWWEVPRLRCKVQGARCRMHIRVCTVPGAP